MNAAERAAALAASAAELAEAAAKVERWTAGTEALPRPEADPYPYALGWLLSTVRFHLAELGRLGIIP